MSILAAEMPGGLWPRLAWLLTRVLGWFLLFAILETLGGALYSLLSLPNTGVYVLAGSFVTLAAAVAAGVILLRWLDRRPPGDLGFPLQPAAARQFKWGFVIGVAALTAAALMIALAGWLSFRRDDGNPVNWIAVLARDFLLFGVAAAAEEAVFRGYAFQVLARATGAPLAVLVASVVFAWAHAQNPNVGTFALFNIFLAGVLLAIAFLLTRSLWFATAIHLGWNWSMASLLDLPVSGLELFDTPVYEPVLSGPDWFTGGAFGPEGGLTGTLALSAAIGAVWAYTHRRPTARAA
jgi:membrane protease YdiL (CAAX protease family)